MSSRPEDGTPTEAYRKHDDDERFLDELNDRLSGFEIEAYADLEETTPTVHVLGMPRSGTTLANQLIAAHTTIAYVDHIAAAFPRAPVTGLRLSEKLRRGLDVGSSFQSDYGRTGSLTEPHEFTYFFSELFNLPTGVDGLAEPSLSHAVDWPRVRRILTNLCAAAHGPLVFKSFHVVWQLAALCAELPRTVVVCVERDELEVALSLLRMRETLYGSREAWASIKPKEWENLQASEDWAGQIAGQIGYTTRALERGLQAVAPGGLVRIGYAELCADPGAFLDRVLAAVTAQGGQAERVGEPPELSVSARPQADSDEARRLRAALQEFETGLLNQ
jgi:hypothetical protein